MFRRICELFATECIDPKRVEALAEEISGRGVWTQEILVHDHCWAILDGHHRFAVANRLGLRWIPCRVVTYGTPGLELSAWRAGEQIQPDDVLKAAESGILLPYKTTRHVLRPALPEISVPLALLSRTEGPDNACLPRSSDVGQASFETLETPLAS